MTDLDVHLDGMVARDPRAFAAWLAAAEPRLRDSLRSFASSVDTEAVVQETMLRIWQVSHRITRDGRPNATLRLAGRIARNLCLDEVRRACPALPLDVDEGGELDGETPMPDPLLRSVLARCREALHGKPAEALDQRIASGGGEPDQTLAARVGMTLNTFLQNVTRARKQLAECLARQGVRLDEELQR